MADEELLTVDEVAPRLRLSAAGVRKMIADGRITAVKIGRRYLVSAAEVERVRREGTSPAAAPSGPVALAGGRVFDRSRGDQEGAK